MTNLRSRILLIVALLIASGAALFPRTVVERKPLKGVMVDDTVRRA